MLEINLNNKEFLRWLNNHYYKLEKGYIPYGFGISLFTRGRTIEELYEKYKKQIKN
jgi:hypothetical protein